jgi:Importin-beta N-terminal domain
MKKAPSVPLPPVSLEEVYSVVTAATSQDPTQIKNATDRLKEILERPGALDCLHEIAIQKTVPLQVRQQSIIQFKNNAGHWRSRR